MDNLRGNRAFVDLLLGKASPPYEAPNTIEKPLSFERLNAGRPLNSQSPFFQLPFDLLDEIAEHIPERSLSAFALTNRHCCRLARARQFSSVHLDYSPRSFQIIHKLLTEANSEVLKSTKVPSIGPAIRRLSVSTKKEYVGGPYLATTNMSVLDHEAQAKKIEEIGTRYKRYLQGLQSALENSLPHLDTIIWADPVTLGEDMFLACSQSTVQNLVLPHVFLDHSFRLDTSLKVWPLRFLQLGVTCANIPSQAKKVCNEILRLCAPHLEKLIWYEADAGVSKTKQSFVGETVGFAQFSVLRELYMSKLRFADQSVFETLLPPIGRLRVLDIDDVDYTHLGRYLEESGPIQSLESLTLLPTSGEPEKQLVQILQNNSHLKRLNLRKAYANEFLSMQLLPLLNSSFKSLVSLSLIGLEDALEESSLQLISQLQTLELLHLSAGMQDSSMITWMVDHNVMRRSLSPLQNLKQIFLSRDTRQPLEYSPSISDDGITASTTSENDVWGTWGQYEQQVIGNESGSDSNNWVEQTVEETNEGQGGTDEDTPNEHNLGIITSNEMSLDEEVVHEGIDVGSDQNSVQSSEWDSDAIFPRMLFGDSRRNELLKEGGKYFATFRKLKTIYIEENVIEQDENGNIRSSRVIAPELFLPVVLGRLRSEVTIRRSPWL